MKKLTNKSWKTNIVALFGAIIAVVALLLVFMEKATLEQAAMYTGGLSTILQTISSYLSKDKDASHTYTIKK